MNMQLLENILTAYGPSGHEGRVSDVIRAALTLNKGEGITIILITHYMEEAIQADRIFVMDRGRIAMQGSPREIFSRVEEMQELHLDVPQVTRVFLELKKRGVNVDTAVYTVEQAAAQLRALKGGEGKC